LHNKFLHIWHGNVFRAMQIIEEMECDIEAYQYENEGKKPNQKVDKLSKTIGEFRSYIGGIQN